jgi:hypothetical protein
VAGSVLDSVLETTEVPLTYMVYKEEALHTDIRVHTPRLKDDGDTIPTHVLPV